MIEGRHYRYYDHAYMVLQDHWHRGAYHDYFTGEMCFVGGLANTDEHDTQIPSHLRKEIEHSLRLYPSFWFGKMVCGGYDNDDFVVEWWNDCPWRRKRTVLRKLRKLRDQSYTPWLADERIRLVGEIGVLKARITTLEAHVVELESNNRLLSYKGHYDLRMDRRELEKLDRDLDKACKSLLEFEGST
jgi:hypothetical protein